MSIIEDENIEIITEDECILHAWYVNHAWYL